jgi:hypothetical protein
MKTQNLFLIIPLVFLFGKSSSQAFQITSTKLEFDGNQLMIVYDIVDKNQADQFYVWVEMEKKNGESIKTKSFSGDVGDRVKAGSNKKITWFPALDSVYLNEEVLVEVKAEKYERSFNKGTMMLMSTVVPGLGQTKISKGKPWWLTGVAAYGALAGGLIVHQQYLKTYDKYKVEEDLLTRKELFDQTQKQMNMSGALIVSGAALWAVNMVWVAIIPNRYQPLKYVNLTLDRTAGPHKGTTLLTFRLNF